MADYPTGSIPTGVNVEYSEKNIRPTYRAPYEAGYEQTRVQCMRTRREWQISYRGITETQKAAITSFFDNAAREYGGKSFTWDHPITSYGDVTVRLVDDEIVFIYAGSQGGSALYNTTFSFREV